MSKEKQHHHHLRERYAKVPGLLAMWRRHAKLSSLKLARKMHVSEGVVKEIEAGERAIGLVEFLEWCGACEVQPEMAIFEIRVAASGHVVQVAGGVKHKTKG